MQLRVLCSNTDSAAAPRLDGEVGWHTARVCPLLGVHGSGHKVQGALQLGGDLRRQGDGWTARASQPRRVRAQPLWQAPLAGSTRVPRSGTSGGRGSNSSSGTGSGSQC